MTGHGRETLDAQLDGRRLPATEDARALRLREPLGSIMGVALLNAANEAQWVLECYTKDDRLLDGADAFLLQVVARLP